MKNKLLPPLLERSWINPRRAHVSGEAQIVFRHFARVLEKLVPVQGVSESRSTCSTDAGHGS
jgi:hypothetical protein